MRSRPIGTPLSDEEAATVARFDAAPDAEESLRERMVDAIYSVHWPDGEPYVRMTRTHVRKIADAAIAVMRGEDV